MKNENSSTIIKEVGISLTKGAIGAIPFVGTLLNEAIFENRGRIKQERINRFINMLQEYMESVSEDSINIEYLKSDEFSDIFESILRRITNIRSDEKMKRFRKILISEMQSPSDTDFVETFLDIVSRLEEVQVQILKDIRIVTNKCGGVHEKVFKSQNEIISLEINRGSFELTDESLNIIISKKNTELQKYLKLLSINQKFYDSNNYELELSQYMFYVQDLISKGLLYERLIPRNKKEPPVTKIIEISKYGEEFLRFIEE